MSSYSLSSLSIHPVLAQADEGGVDFPTIVMFLVLGLTTLVMLVVIAGFMAFGKLWLQAFSSGCPIEVKDLVGMYLRKSKPRVIVEAMIRLRKSGIPIEHEKLQAHELGGGDVDAVTEALVMASRGGLALSFEEACAIDLTDRDVVDEVRIRVQGGGGIAVAETVIHPAGKLKLEDGEVVDAVSDEGIIAMGRKVVVLRRSRDVATVREATLDELQGPRDLR